MGHPYGSPGHYHDNQVGRLAQPLKQGSTSPAKCVTAHATTVTLTLAIMNRDGALPYLPSCRTRHIRAELQGRVHRLCIICLHRHSMPMFPSFFKPSFLPFHQLVGFYPVFFDHNYFIHPQVNIGCVAKTRRGTPWPGDSPSCWA